MAARVPIKWSHHRGMSQCRPCREPDRVNDFLGEGTSGHVMEAYDEEE